MVEAWIKEIWYLLDLFPSKSVEPFVDIAEATSDVLTTIRFPQHKVDFDSSISRYFAFLGSADDGVAIV
ncbi:unnamed protein product [Heligmosomoides polygyrus]|uniref:PWI domain-containing protein n=1 Tax=Heligmosomoides polygyrus TaxID=6339 RepID=A0A183FSD6_HELPZ|nr:unnamed protein product [Heligmosomoides polygyrus]